MSGRSQLTWERSSRGPEIQAIKGTKKLEEKQEGGREGGRKRGREVKRMNLDAALLSDSTGSMMISGC